MQTTRDLFMLWALSRFDSGNFRNFIRISVWHLAAAPFWLAGCCVDSNARLVAWAIAVGIETAGPSFGYWIPRLGRSTTADWLVEGGHMAERGGLFVIIALGESVLITGATFADLEWSAVTIAAFVTAFAGSIAMWAVYFNVGAERASRQIASSDDPGRLARSAYTYIHALIVAGIIVAAVGDELVLHHADGHAGVESIAALIGGPALYLGGNALFKRLTAANTPLSHLIGLGLLALLVPLAPHMTALALSAATAAVLIMVAVWEWWSFAPGRKSKQPH
jgi:low temperature requirement protein LtrA